MPYTAIGYELSFEPSQHCNAHFILKDRCALNLFADALGMAATLRP